ncbi:hypothetical protein SGLAM104S_01394 [Streptomyces glaucescens]
MPSRVGTQRTRSAKERSESSCHSETSRCSHSRSESSRAVCWRTSSFMEGTGASVPGGLYGTEMCGLGRCRTAPHGPGDTRGPRRLGGTLNPPGTAARSNIGRGVCGPGRPKDEEPGQSGQRAPVPRSVFLCGEDGCWFPRMVPPLRDYRTASSMTAVCNDCGLDHSTCPCVGSVCCLKTSAARGRQPFPGLGKPNPPRSSAGPNRHGNFRERFEFRPARAVARLLGHALDHGPGVPGERRRVGAGRQRP